MQHTNECLKEKVYHCTKYQKKKIFYILPGNPALKHKYSALVLKLLGQKMRRKNELIREMVLIYSYHCVCVWGGGYCVCVGGYTVCVWGGVLRYG